LGFYRLVQSSLVDGQVSNDQKNSKALPLLKKISPVAWQNIHFHGRYTFCGSRHPINLDAMVANRTFAFFCVLKIFCAVLL
jgi:hypothetical protein